MADKTGNVVFLAWFKWIFFGIKNYLFLYNQDKSLATLFIRRGADCCW